MWLIDVHTLQLKNCLRRNVWIEHPYAILSHTWGQEEVTFQDIQDLRLARSKAGFVKIERTCEQAKVDGLRFAWIDTCCIDKTSSAELQEAINSMFEWYARASKCYAFLEDVDKEVDDNNIQSSRWFTRGWTLQELIAPKNVCFFDRNWDYLGHRSDLEGVIADRTGIHSHLMKHGVLFDVEPDIPDEPRYLSTQRRWLGRYSLAQRMSWAADRETTRIEDRAYSLLGIFGVSIPLLYGEGNKSFIRLQEEILRANRSPQPDFSILLWEKPDQLDSAGSHEDYFESLLAISPDAFRKCGNIVFHRTTDVLESITDLSISTIGIRARMRVIPLYISDHEHADFAAVLNCYDRSDITSTIGLKLISQRNMILGEPASEAASNTLYATPYSVADITEHGARQRTIHIDAVQAEEESISRSIFLAREKPNPYLPSVWVEAAPQQAWPESVSRSIDTPDHIWVRLNSVGRHEPRWSVTHAYPSHSWNLSRLTFNTKEYFNNIMHAPQHLFAGNLHPRPCIVGAIALHRPDTNMSRVVVSVACTLISSISDAYPRSPKRGNVFFRIHAIEPHQQLDAETLRGYCADLVRENVPLEDTGRRWAALVSQVNQTRLGAGCKGVHLYEGTKIYDGAVFAIQPQLRFFVGRGVVVLQVVNLRSMRELE